MTPDARVASGRRERLWLVALALTAIPLVAHSLGTPLGEPFADDFHFLHRELLSGERTWWDGGGSPLYWRPLGRQAYFTVLGAAMLAWPWLVAVLHAGLLVAGAMLVHRALRRSWPAPWAAAAASFPLLVESARMLLAWPSHFQDVGALFLASLTLHEAAFGRLGTMLAALLGSLLCKEVGALTALLLPWFPGAVHRDRAWRLRATLAVVALVGAWAAAYATVTARAGVGFAHEFGTEAAAAGTPLAVRVPWALGNGLRAAFSLPGPAGPWDALVGWSVAGLLAWVAFALAFRPAARAALRKSAPLALWGAAWFAASCVPLVEVYPIWSAQRAVFASAGAGVMVVALLASAAPMALAPLVALRLFTFATGPAASSALPETVAGSEADFDMRHLSRLQSFARRTRDLLRERYPALPPGSVIGDHHLPFLTRHALAGDRALQVWYRDTTLRWLGFEEFRGATATPVAAFVEYQPIERHPLALVDGAAMRELLEASEHMRGSVWNEALAALGRAESAQRDRAALVFLGTLASKRAVCLSAIGRPGEAERSARRGLELWSGNPDSRYTLAELRFAEGAHARAETLLIEQLTLHPTDAGSIELLDRVRRDWLARQRR